jgi:hypothetical protein
MKPSPAGKHKLREFETMITETKDTTMNAETMQNGTGAGGRGSMFSPAALLSLAILLLSTVSLWGCGTGSQAGGATPDMAYSRVINVEVTPVAVTSFTETIRLTGTVQAHRDVVISAEESGVVREILAEKGSLSGRGSPSPAWTPPSCRPSWTRPGPWRSWPGRAGSGVSASSRRTRWAPN